MLLPTLVRMGNLSLPSRSVQGLEIGSLGSHDVALQYIVIHMLDSLMRRSCNCSCWLGEHEACVVSNTLVETIRTLHP